MSIIGSNILAGAAGSGVSAYEIEQSLRFNDDDSHSLNRTPSSAGNRRTWTYSAWVKLAEFGDFNCILAAGDYNYGTYIWFHDQHFAIGRYSGGYTFIVESAAFYRDPSAWYHVVVTFDSTQATASDRVKLYINNEQITSFTNQTYPSQNFDADINDTSVHYIGKRRDNNLWLRGYLAEVHLVDGTALDPTSFGEYDDNGVWRPKRYTGSYGTNGFYLNFSNSSSLGEDQAGSNDWTPNNFTTSGTGTDVMSDTPTTNWCTLNPLDKYNNSAVVAQNGNLEFAQGGAAWWAMRASFGLTSGKWYWEVKNISGLYQAPGLGNAAADLNGYFDEPNVWLYVNTGQLTVNGTTNSAASWGGNSHTTNDTVGVAFDADNGKLWFSKNGTWQGDASPNPATDTDPAVTGLTNGPYFPYFVQYQTTTEVNFGQRDFAYTPPTGFKALNTSNLPAPDIADGSQYFDIATWSGDNASSRDIPLSNSSIVPDFVWVKPRGPNNANHVLFDAVRGFGSGKGLSSDTTGIEGGSSDATYGYVSGTAAGEFTVNYATSGNLVNLSGQTYVGWAWDAGGSGSSNTNGTITSTVSANPTAGFSIVSYTGTGANATVGHGLGVAPSLLMIKNRDTNSSWMVGHQNLGSWSDVIFLDLTSAKATDSTVFNGTAPTSTVFSVGTNFQSNKLNDDMIAYCFAEVEGYSKFGSYEGNNTDNNNAFVYLGFTPAFLMIKNIDASTNWIIHDTTRDTYNPSSTDLYPNTSGAEPSYEDNYMDFLSNGFKIRDTSGPSGNSNTYIFAAFASNPFGGSGISPATAR